MSVWVSGAVFFPPRLGCVLRGNAAYLNGATGIDANDSGAEGCVIEDNHAIGNAKNGIVAADAALRSNAAIENGQSGIYPKNRS